MAGRAPLPPPPPLGKVIYEHLEKQEHLKPSSETPTEGRLDDAFQYEPLGSALASASPSELAPEIQDTLEVNNHKLLQVLQRALAEAQQNRTRPLSKNLQALMARLKTADEVTSEDKIGSNNAASTLTSAEQFFALFHGSGCPVRNSLDPTKISAFLGEALDGNSELPRSQADANHRAISLEQAEESASRRRKLVSLIMSEPVSQASHLLDVVASNKELLQDLTKRSWKPFLIEEVQAVPAVMPEQHLTELRFRQSDALELGGTSLDIGRVDGPSIAYNKHQVGVYGPRVARAFMAATAITESLGELLPDDSPELGQAMRGIIFDAQQLEAANLTRAAVIEAAVTTSQLYSIILARGIHRPIDDDSATLVDWEELMNSPKALVDVATGLAAVLPFGTIQPFVMNNHQLVEPPILSQTSDGRVGAITFSESFWELVQTLKQDRILLSADTEAVEVDETTVNDAGLAHALNADDMFFSQTKLGCPMLGAMIQQNNDGELERGPSPLKVFTESFLNLTFALYRSDLEL